MLDVERSDYMRTPGRTAYLSVGPFGFVVDTADGGRIGFAISIRGMSFGWDWSRE